MAKMLQFSLDQRGLDRMVEALKPENRKEGVARAIRAGASIIQNKVRSNYQRIKPESDLYKAIRLYKYPSAEGAVVRRFYVKGGVGAKYKKGEGRDAGPLYRAYILNFIEHGTSDRHTKGKGKKYRGARYSGLNRGSIPASKFFRKGVTGSVNKAFKEIERQLLIEIAKQAKK